MPWTRRRFIKVGLAALAGGVLLDSLVVERFWVEETEHCLAGSQG